jgi:hypothetical protein
MITGHVNHRGIPQLIHDEPQRVTAQMNVPGEYQYIPVYPPHLEATVTSVPTLEFQMQITHELDTHYDNPLKKP